LIGHPAEAGHNFVDISNRDASRTVTAHLLGHGRRRPAMITGPEWVISARDRREGFLDAVRASGLDPAAVPILSGDFTSASGYAVGLELLSRDDRPDFVFAASDAIAIGVIDAARSLGLVVPDDVAVAGFDDIMVHRNEQVGLTSICQPVDAMGNEAVNRLDQLIHHRIEPPVGVWLDTTLRIRRSCGCDVPVGTPGDGAVGKEGAIAPA
jgi:LacI family transcriptional regulator